jgi:hypothetical protein
VDWSRVLLERLPSHLGNGEVAGRDAVAIVEPLLETLFPDPAERERQRKALRERMAQSTPEAPLLQAQSDRAARYASAEAAELAQWNATPPERRDPHQLEARLEALRREIFDEAPQGKPPAPSR